MKLKAPALALTAVLVATSAAGQQTPEDAEQLPPVLQSPADVQKPAGALEPPTGVQPPPMAVQPPPMAVQPPGDAQYAPLADRPPPLIREQPGVGEQERPFMAVAGGSVTWDSNVFRLPDSVDTEARLGRSKSDRISAMYVGLRVDKPYAQQRFRLDLTETAYRYQNLSFLDFDALRYRGEWQWHLTPRLSGTLGADRDEALVSFADFRDTSRNVRITENRVLSADAWLFGGWHLLGGLRQQETKNSVPFVQLGSYRASGGEAGVRYVAGSGNSVAFSFRRLDARYTDRPLDPVSLLDDGFRRTETGLLATWLVTVKSAFDASLARIEHRSNHFAQRNFFGTAASLAYRWTPTAKLSLNVSASRDLQPWLESFASYRIDERLSVGPTWQFGPRTALRASLGRAASSFRNPLPGFAAATRRDALHTAQLALDWRLPRNLTINASLLRQKQTSTDAAFSFDANVATVGVTLLF